MLAQHIKQLMLGALVLAALSATSNASAQAPGSRFVILVPSGDPTLAHALGQGVRERAQSVLTSDGFAAVLGPASCADALEVAESAARTSAPSMSCLMCCASMSKSLVNQWAPRSARPIDRLVLRWKDRRNLPERKPAIARTSAKNTWQYL